MRHNYHREDVYRFSFDELKQFIIDAEALEMPDYIYEELQETIRSLQAEEHTAQVKVYHGVKDGSAYCGYDSGVCGSDALVYWLASQGEKEVS